MAFNTNPGKQSFTASANQTEFDFNFKIYEPTDIQVFKTPKDQDPNDGTDKLVYPGDYTITIDGDDGGKVILTTPSTLDDTVVLKRELPLIRDTSYVTNGDLKAVTLNADQDYQTYLIIDANVSLENAIRLPKSAVNVDPILPNVRPNSYLRWNVDGSGLENDETIPDAVIDAAASAAAALVSETNAANHLDEFTDLYLGAKASDPLTDNDGDPLQVGALYLNTTDNAMKVYNGTTWVLAYASIVGGVVSSSYFDKSKSLSGSNTNLVIPDLYAKVGSELISITSETIDINTAGYWDDPMYASAVNRAGKDFYIYGREAGGYILSNNSTYPLGYTADNTRKLGGFHCLCVAVGTISGHALTNYIAGDILPRSCWDLKHKPRSEPEGMVQNWDGVWVDIYLPSLGAGGKLVSKYNVTIADGGNGWHTYKFEQNFGVIAKRSISQVEFVVASLGSNQSTSILGSVDPVTTGGHKDTANRRMVSNIGCEDMCGALWQWSRDAGGVQTAVAWANAYDANDTGVGGQHYQAPARALLGGVWYIAAVCGSRASYWNIDPLDFDASVSGRGSAESVDL